MRWTKEAPTIEGWYWMRDRKGGPKAVGWWEPGEERPAWIETAGPWPEPEEDDSE